MPELASTNASSFHLAQVSANRGVALFQTVSKFRLRGFQDSSGSLGTGGKASSLVPVSVIQPSGIRALSAGFNHSLALRSDGMLHAFGFNQYGRLGDGTTISSATAVPVLGGVR